jgi:small nuclear ribonucleoprotein (snRNP)-like protein
MDEKKTMIGRKVFIKTTSGRNYTGIVDEEDSNFIYITDKFEAFVRIAISTIEVIEEVRQ